MSAPFDPQAYARRYLRRYFWLEPFCIVGAVLNLCNAINDICTDDGWWSWLFAALWIGCSGICMLVLHSHRRFSKVCKGVKQ